MSARAFLTAEHSLTTAEHAVLQAARCLARAQTEVVAETGAWMAAAEFNCGAEWDRLVAARRARNDAADHLHDIASRELAAELAGVDVPAFLLNRVNGGRA